MKKRHILMLSIIFTLILAFFSYIKKTYNYTIILLSLSLTLSIFLILTIRKSKNPKTRYNNLLNDILKTYDGILVDSNNIPELGEKNIISVKSISEMIDAQSEIRKPIYVYKELDTCSFILIDSDEVCVYTLKMDENISSPIDEMIKNKTNNEIEILTI